VFSVLKRKFGESLKARKYRLQVKEIKIKVILYNLSRAMKSFSVLVVIEEFYRANDSAFTGLEAAIVLIAFVVVAAVFAYVILGAGFFTTQKSQETVYKGVEQATSNIQMIGQVYGMSSASGTNSSSLGIERIKFSIGLAPGAPSSDLTKMIVVYSNETTTPVIMKHTTGTVSTVAFTTTRQGTAVTSMAGQEQVEIEFLIGSSATTDTSNTPGKNTKISIELRPAVGASLPFTRTIPATLKEVNMLY
jgi:flagellin FlaB